LVPDPIPGCGRLGAFGDGDYLRRSRIRSPRRLLVITDAYVPSIAPDAYTPEIYIRSNRLSPSSLVCLSS